MPQGFFGGQERIFEFSPRQKFWGLKAKKKAPDFQQLSLNSSAFYCANLCKMWRRVWDSNPRAQRANGFQDRLVMTTSITLRVRLLSFQICEFFRKSFRSNNFLLRRKGESIRRVKAFWHFAETRDCKFSRPPRYDRCAYPTRRSISLLIRRRVWVYSPWTKYASVNSMQRR